MDNRKEKTESEDSRVARKPSSLIKSIKASPFKKVSALLGFIALIVGLIAGIIGLVKQYLTSRELNKAIAMHIEVGDRFAEQYKPNEGIAEYEKALEKDKNNIEAHRKIIAAMRMKFEVQIEPIPKVEDVQARIYQLQALHPKLKDDIQLMIEEARVLRYNYEPHTDQFNRAVQIMARAYDMAPEDPEVLAQMGLLNALDSQSGKVQGIELINKAVALMPNEYRYHLYLGRAMQLEGNYNQAINYFYRSLKLLQGDNRNVRFTRKWLLEKLGNLLWAAFHEDGALTSKLDLTFNERAEIFELIEKYAVSFDYEDENPSFSSYFSPPLLQQQWYIGELYDALGCISKADSIMQIALREYYYCHNDCPEWRLMYWYNLESASLYWNYKSIFNYKDHMRSKFASLYHEWLIKQKMIVFHLKIMEARGRDARRMAEARSLLEVMNNFRYHKSWNARSYDLSWTAKIQWCWDSKFKLMRRIDYRYNTGLEIYPISSDAGIRVLEVERNDMFDEAGIQPGDVILQLANKKVGHFADIESILFQFAGGEEIPIKFKRHNTTQESTLRIKASADCEPSVVRKVAI